MMHRTFLLLVLLGFNATTALADGKMEATSGVLSSLDSHGLSFSVDFFNDIVAPTQRGSGAVNNIDFADWSGTLDLDRLTGNDSVGKLYFSFHHTDHHWSGSQGELQTISNADASPVSRLAEFWFERKAFQGATLRFGKVDANRDFATVECASDFLNSSMGYTPAFFTLPNFNATRWGGELLLSHGKLSTNFASFLTDHSGVLGMGEAGLRWRWAEKPGRTAFGYWASSGEFPTFAGEILDRTSGMYVTVEQNFWNHDGRSGRATESLTTYMQYGSADPELSIFHQQLGSGIVWQAPLSRRDRDSAGLAVSRGELTDQTGAGFNQSDEIVLESYYKFYVRQQLSFTADMQYFSHPGGVASVGNFLAVTARMKLSLTSHRER